MRRRLVTLLAGGLWTVVAACGAFGADDPTPAPSNPSPDASPAVDASSDATSAADGTTTDASDDGASSGCPTITCPAGSNPCLAFDVKSWSHSGLGLGKPQGSGFQTTSDGTNSSTFAPAPQALPTAWTFQLEMEVGSSGTATIARISALGANHITIEGATATYRACVSRSSGGQDCTRPLPRPASATMKQRVRLTGALSGASADVTLTVGCGAAAVQEPVTSVGPGFVSTGSASDPLEIEIGVMAPGGAARTDVDDLRFGVVRP